MAQAVELENIDIWGTQLRNTLSRSMSRTIRQNPSIRSWSSRGPDNVFTRSLHSRRDPEDDDEEALKWAALEKLPTYDRLRTSILKSFEGGKVITQEIDVRNLGMVERQMLIEKLLKVTEEDNERFLIKLRNRIDKYVTFSPWIFLTNHKIRDYELREHVVVDFVQRELGSEVRGGNFIKKHVLLTTLLYMGLLPHKPHLLFVQMFLMLKDAYTLQAHNYISSRNVLKPDLGMSSFIFRGGIDRLVAQ